MHTYNKTRRTNEKNLHVSFLPHYAKTTQRIIIKLGVVIIYVIGQCTIHFILEKSTVPVE